MLYGSSAWTLTKRLENKLNGTYACMLRPIINMHCCRSKDEVVTNLILCTPKHGKAKVRQPSKTYTKQLTENADCQLEDLPRAMEDIE